MTDIYKPSDEQKERIRKLVKDFLQEQNTSVYKLAQMLEKTYGRSGSVSNLLNKLARATFKISELMDIADLFDYEVKFVKKQAIEGHENLTDNNSADNA